MNLEDLIRDAFSCAGHFADDGLSEKTGRMVLRNEFRERWSKLTDGGVDSSEKEKERSTLGSASELMRRLVTAKEKFYWQFGDGSPEAIGVGGHNVYPIFNFGRVKIYHEADWIWILVSLPQGSERSEGFRTEKVHRATALGQEIRQWAFDLADYLTDEVRQSQEQRREELLRNLARELDPNFHVSFLEPGFVYSLKR